MVLYFVLAIITVGATMILISRASKKHDSLHSSEKVEKHYSHESVDLHHEDIKRQPEEPKPPKEDDFQKKHTQKEQEIQLAISQNPGSEMYRLDNYESEASSSLLGITEFTPISKKRYVAFDFETTGLDAGGDRIIEIGAVRVINGEITDEYSQLIDPECSIPKAASSVNHITDDMVFGMPKIHQALPAFLSFVGGDVLAAHNARFDAKFLQQACMRNRFKVPEKFFDTMTLARYWPDAENKKLGTLLSVAGIENDEAHRALGDARAVARLITVTNDKRKSSRNTKKQGEVI